MRKSLRRWKERKEDKDEFRRQRRGYIELCEEKKREEQERMIGK